MLIKTINLELPVFKSFLIVHHSLTPCLWGLDRWGCPCSPSLHHTQCIWSWTESLSKYMHTNTHNRGRRQKDNIRECKINLSGFNDIVPFYRLCLSSC